MRRMLLTLPDTRCPFGCTYCFAEFGQYERPLSLADVERSPRLLEGVDVVYPACDVDLFATSKPLEILRRTAAFKRSISVSTKATLSERHLVGLAHVAKQLEMHGRILKIGVSISTKHNCRTLEPRASNYASRLANLELLKRAFVPSCIVVKPILADVPVEEYCEIVSDAAGLTEYVLIGDEYLDVTNPRMSLETARQRLVPWALNQPIWPVRPSASHRSSIRECAEGLGLRVFDSDLELMTVLAQRSAVEPCLSSA